MNAGQPTRRQVITVGRDGSLQGLQHKPGQGLDLRKFGPAQVVRASEVVWLEMEQAWAVEFRSGPLSGAPLDDSHLMAAGLDHQNPPFPVKGRCFLAYGRSVADDHGVLLFEDYDDGVKAEVAVLDGLRLAGVY